MTFYVQSNDILPSGDAHYMTAHYNPSANNPPLRRRPVLSASNPSSPQSVATSIPNQAILPQPNMAANISLKHSIPAHSQMPVVYYSAPMPSATLQPAFTDNPALLQTVRGMQTVQAIQGVPAAHVHHAHPMQQLAQINHLASNPIFPSPAYLSNVSQPMQITNPSIGNLNPNTNITQGPLQQEIRQVHQQVISQQHMQTYSVPVIPSAMQSVTHPSAVIDERSSPPIDLLDASMAQLLDSINPVLSDGPNPPPPPPQVVLSQQPFMGISSMAHSAPIQQRQQPISATVLLQQQNLMPNDMPPIAVHPHPPSHPSTAVVAAAAAAAAATAAAATSESLNSPQKMRPVQPTRHPSSSDQQKYVPLTRKKTVLDWSTIPGMSPKAVSAAPVAPSTPRRTAIKKEDVTHDLPVKRPRSPQGASSPVASAPSKMQMDGIQPDPAEEDVEVKKMMRAERNRQSAAASRERKKQYMNDLERRVNSLSKENASLHVNQLTTLQDRINYERELLAENDKLRMSMITHDCLISKMSSDLKALSVAVEPSPATLNRNTWDCAELANKIQEIKAGLQKKQGC